MCDTAARQLSNVERSAVADYLSVQIIKSDELTVSTAVLEHERTVERCDYARDKSANWSRLHPSLDRVYNKVIVLPFVRFCAHIVFYTNSICCPRLKR